MGFDDQTTSGPLKPRQDRVHDDNYVLNELKRIAVDNTDAFGNSLTQNTQSRADLPGHYPYSPERWRVLVNGERQLIQYGSVPEYNYLGDAHQLTPQASGDSVTMETTEIYKYVVGYVLEWSGALETNQPLQTGDIVVFGYGQPDLANATGAELGSAADGWFFYWTGDHDPGTVTLAQYRDGTEQDAETVDVRNALAEWARYEGQTNWYSVGATNYEQTTTSDGEQINESLGATSNDNGRGPLSGNQKIKAGVRAGSSAPNLSLTLGSVGAKLLGGVDPIFREKTHSFTATIDQTGTWIPVHAMRIDPTRDHTTVQIENTDIIEFSGSGDVRATIQTYDETKALDANGNELDDADFMTPTELNDVNSVIQVTDAIEQVAAADGTVSASVANPGGYQVGYASWFSSGQGSGTQVASGSATRKRRLPENDIGVLLVNATATGDLTVEMIGEEDW